MHALERALLSKLPTSIRVQRQALEDKLIEAEAVSTSLPWTFDQLAKIAAQHIIAAARRSGSSASPKEVNSGEAKPGKSRKCPCCGQLGHEARGCKSKCKQSMCDLRSCPGNYGGTCIFSDATPIPDTVLNALGKQVPQPILTWMKRKHATLFSTTDNTPPASPAAKSTNAMHASSPAVACCSAYSSSHACISTSNASTARHLARGRAPSRGAFDKHDARFATSPCAEFAALLCKYRGPARSVCRGYSSRCRSASGLSGDLSCHYRTCYFMPHHA